MSSILVVVMPDIEGHDSEEASRSRRCFLRATVEREREMGAVDDGKKERQHREQAAARKRGEEKHDENASEKKGKAVIDDIERGETIAQANRSK
jgi:hypothetical protein